MIYNGKLVAEDGNQVAVFPSQDLYLTQGTNTSYSHTNTKNTDNASDQGRKQIYAPCDMKLVSKQPNGSFGIMIYHTVNKVWTSLYGLTHFTLVMMHVDDTSPWVVGKTYQQGSHIYNEGVADPSGLTTGVHVHYEVALGHQTTRSKGSGDDDNFEINNSVYLDDVFYINSTVIQRADAPDGDHRYSWLEFDGETSGGGGEPVDPGKSGDILTLMMVNALPGFM